MDTRSHHYGTFTNPSGENTTSTDQSGVTHLDSTATMVTRDDEAPSKAGDASVALAEAIQHEHDLTFWEAAKLYPKAVGWSAFVSIGVIMLAFDPQIIGNMFAMPQFQKDFGFELDGEVCSLLFVFCSMFCAKEINTRTPTSMSSRHPGKRAYRWETLSDRLLAHCSRLTRWNCSVASGPFSDASS